MSERGVLLVSPYDLSVPGGVQGQAAAMSLELRRRGRRVALAAPGLVEARELADAGVLLLSAGPVRSLPANGSVAPVGLSPGGSRRVRRWAASHGPFVAHLHEPATPVTGWSLLRHHQGGLVGTFHRSGVDAVYRRAAPLLRRLLGRLDAAVAVSDAAAATALVGTGLICDVLFNGIDVDEFASAPRWPATPRTVLFLGRDEPRKGRQVLLDAAALLDEDVTIWLTGEPPADRADVGARLDWLGRISEDDKRARLAGATVLCAPSLGGESFGMVLLEGLAAGCTVVASDIDGYREALGGHGILVPPSDPVALAEALRGALAAPLPAAPGLAHARRWSMATLMDAYEERYELAAAASGARRRR